MPKETKIFEILKQAGYQPLEDRTIIVTQGANNLSAKIANFFHNQFYVLQLCEQELVLIPFGQLSYSLKKEVALEIPYSTIRSVEIREDVLNYLILIQTDADQIYLSAQQKELSDLRSAGLLASDFLGNNWHKENLDKTLKALKAL